MIEVLRGMRDKMFLEALKTEYICENAKNIFKLYGYTPIYTPLVEHTELFTRGVGKTTDVVSKEMYDFQDKGGRNISLRPEGTASAVRAYLNAGLHKSSPNYKCYYMGNMYRYEAPQKGRYREFMQIGVESFGIKSAIHDAEIVKMALDLLNSLKITDLEIEVNNIGDFRARQEYKKDLLKYLEPKKDKLSKDSQRRLIENPFRVLDSKDIKDQEVVKDAPKIYDYLDDEEKKYYSDFLSALNNFGITPIQNPLLVRGLDYYSSIVFEIKSKELNSTICAGGRYDMLLEILGNTKTPAIGFALGVDRVSLLIDDVVQNSKKVYLAYNSDTLNYMQHIAQKLRENKYIVEYDYSPKSFSSQLKKADKLGYEDILILGEDEKNKEVVTFKNLKNKEQETITLSEYIGRKL